MHTYAVSQPIQEAKENKDNLAVIWLNIANAYGPMPHKLVETMLPKYHMPTKLQNLLQHDFESFKMRFTVGECTTRCQLLEVGIFTGCTISEILFTVPLNLLLKSAEVASRGPCTASGVQQPPIIAFMTITSRSIVECRWMLEDLEKLVSWARMEFKSAIIQKSGPRERQSLEFKLS